MAMIKCSSLNPLASTFIPSNVSGALANEAAVFATEREIDAKESISIRSVASLYVQKIMEFKRERGEHSLTKPEMVSLIQKLICLQYKIGSGYDMLNVRSYLSDKIPNVVLLNLSERDESSGSYRTNPQDLSTYRPPSQSILLVAFYGLYRHEQAFRPMLSLPHRPEALQDRVWSVTNKDLQLWNGSVVQSCSCPPMFGYVIPPDVFGNIFKLSNLCPMKEIHMSCSEESENGNEFILQENVRVDPIVEQGFVDFEETVAARSDLCYYSEQLKSIVSSVCSIIDDLMIKSPEAEYLMDEVYESYEHFTESLWNADISELNRPAIDEIEEDDDCHPLLDVKRSDVEDEVPMEVKELLRRSLSNESDAEMTPNNCNPPCSVWCCELERSDSLHNRTKSDSCAIDLLSDTTEFLSGISPSVPLLPLKHLKPSFRRSFSANDCDPSYDQKYKPKISTSLRRDPVQVFKAKGHSGSWKDSDSGFMTPQWSSQEDVFCDEESDEGFKSSDGAPMWNFFSGEDSLWKPLPASEQSKSLAHKRVRDLKRQTSSVN